MKTKKNKLFFIALLICSLFVVSETMYEATYQLENEYLPTITSPSQYNFYLGYIKFLYEVSLSPGLIEITNGNSM